MYYLYVVSSAELKSEPVQELVKQYVQPGTWLFRVNFAKRRSSNPCMFPPRNALAFSHAQDGSRAFEPVRAIGSMRAVVEELLARDLIVLDGIDTDFF